MKKKFIKDEEREERIGSKEEAVIKAYNIIRFWAQKHREEILAIGSEVEDFTQEVVENILRREGFNHYDKNKVTSFQSLINLISKRHLIDKKRRFFRKRKLDAEGTFASEISSVCIDEENGEEVDIYTFVKGQNDYDMDEKLLLMDVLSALPDTFALKTAYFKVSWKKLFTDYMDNFCDVKILAENYRVPASTINKKIFQLKNKVKETIY